MIDSGAELSAKGYYGLTAYDTVLKYGDVPEYNKETKTLYKIIKLILENALRTEIK